MMKKRWISLFVENDIGVLARISGLFSGKSYNLKMFVKIHGCSEHDMMKLSYIKEIFQAKMIDYAPSTALIESVQTETGNNDLIKLLESDFSGRIEVVRGGSVAIEAISFSE